MNQIATKNAGSWVTDIFAITLFVEDLQVSKQFYLRVFDLPVDYEDENSAVFKFGKILINLLKATEGQTLVEPAQVASPETGSRFVFTIHVDVHPAPHMAPRLHKALAHAGEACIQRLHHSAHRGSLHLLLRRRTVEPPDLRRNAHMHRLHGHCVLTHGKAPQAA